MWCGKQSAQALHEENDSQTAAVGARQRVALERYKHVDSHCMAFSDYPRVRRQEREHQRVLRQ